MKFFKKVSRHLKKTAGRLNPKKQALHWVKRNDPVLYKTALKRHLQARKGLSGVGGISDFFTTLVDTAKTAVPIVTQYKAQGKILKAQLKRAEQGLPPLQVDDYSPVLRVEPSFGTSGNTIAKYAIPIAIGVGALILLNRKRR